MAAMPFPFNGGTVENRAKYVKKDLCYCLFLSFLFFLFFTVDSLALVLNSLGLFTDIKSQEVFVFCLFNIAAIIILRPDKYNNLSKSDT